MRSGGVFYGGLIAAVAVALWYLRRHKLPMWTMTDVFAPGIALGHVIGRLGCLFAGCCFGKPTTCRGPSRSPIQFAAQNVGTPLGVPLHPTQLYEAGAELLILAFLLVTERRAGRSRAARSGATCCSTGSPGSSSSSTAAIARRDRLLWMALSTSQFVSVFIVPLSIVMLCPARSQAGPAPAIRARRARAA